jgi:hypothetical protein
MQQLLSYIGLTDIMLHIILFIKAENYNIKRIKKNIKTLTVTNFRIPVTTLGFVQYNPFNTMKQLI